MLRESCELNSVEVAVVHCGERVLLLQEACFVPKVLNMLWLFFRLTVALERRCEDLLLMGQSLVLSDVLGKQRYCMPCHNFAKKACLFCCP